VSVNPISAYGAGKIAGAVEEQERIIKVLDGEAFTKAFGRSKDFKAKRASLIALIKGEVIE
jgi:hypothetical protein